MIFRIKFKDSTPCVGIFEVIDDSIGTMTETLDNVKVVAGIADGGIMFHRDLVREMRKSGELSKETNNFIDKNYTHQSLHKCFPRGRVCYNFNDKCFEIYSNVQLLQDEEQMRRILEEFDIKGYKYRAYIDNQEYSVLPKEELK